MMKNKGLVGRKKNAPKNFIWKKQKKKQKRFEAIIDGHQCHNQRLNIVKRIHENVDTITNINSQQNGQNIFYSQDFRMDLKHMNSG